MSRFTGSGQVLRDGQVVDDQHTAADGAGAPCDGQAGDGGDVFVDAREEQPWTCFGYVRTQNWQRKRIFEGQYYEILSAPRKN